MRENHDTWRAGKCGRAMARSKVTVLSTLIAIPLAMLTYALAAQNQAPNAALSVNASAGEWRYLNSDPLATRYSPLDQINKDNFGNLKIAWRWKPGIPPAPSSLEATRRANG